MAWGVSISGVSVLVAVAERLAVKPLTGLVAVSLTASSVTVMAGSVWAVASWAMHRAIGASANLL